MSNLERTGVLDRRTTHNDFGDFVRCCNCGRIMLVDIEEYVCPECQEVDTFMWEDIDYEEVSDDFFLDNKDYILIDVEE